MVLDDRKLARNLIGLIVLYGAAMILVVLLGSGCARPVPGGGGGAPPPPPPSKALLVLFGAPPCSNCHRDFPEIKRLLDATPASDKKDLRVLLYVETGSRWTDPPSPGVALAYAASLGLPWDAWPDGTKNGRPSYEVFTKLTGVPVTEAALPAAVVMLRGEVADVFRAGGTSFVPTLIVDRAIARAKQ